MQLPGLITIREEQTDLIDRLSIMMGRSFLEENWMKIWLTALDPLQATDQHKLAISEAIMKNDFTVGARYECAYTLEDMTGAVGGYLASDLQGHTWNELEEESLMRTAHELLGEEEREALMEKASSMESITNSTWMIEDATGRDFMHFFSLAVDVNKRGSGAFRRMITPFCDYGDQHGIDAYLECYSDRLEAVYGHFGFETVMTLDDPAFDISQRCMIRRHR